MNGLEIFKLPLKFVSAVAFGVVVAVVVVSCAPEANNSNVDKAVKDSTSQNQPNSEPIPDNLKTGMTFGEKK